MKLKMAHVPTSNMSYGLIFGALIMAEGIYINIILWLGGILVWDISG